jgi:hypothetical protein
MGSWLLSQKNFSGCFDSGSTSFGLKKFFILSQPKELNTSKTSEIVRIFFIVYTLSHLQVKKRAENHLTGFPFLVLIPHNFR